MSEDNNICEFCGINLTLEREMFSTDRLFTGHNCKGNNLDQRIYEIISKLRQAGIPCFKLDGITTEELDAEIKGWG